MLARRLVLAFGAAALVVVALIVRDGDDAQVHRFSVTVSSATNVVAGQGIRQSGVEVGRITDIKPARRGRGARLEFELQNRAWPLRAGSRFKLRWGGTANFGNRYLALTPGRGPGDAVTEGGVLPASAVELPVEIDQVLAALPRRTREDLQRMLDLGGPALAASSPALRRALLAAPPALDQAGAVLDDINSDHRALTTLVRSASNVVGVLDSSQPAFGELLRAAGTTFDAVATEQTSLKAMLSRAPQTLRVARATLSEADGTLDRADAVVRRLGPGVRDVRVTARPLASLLRTVRDIGPTATATLVTARKAAPDVTKLLDRGRGVAPQLRSVGKQAVDNLRCIRPFTPDIVAFFSNWGDFLSGTDGKDKLLRAQVQNFLPAASNATPYNVAEAKKLFPDLEYGFPRPPGTNAGQPWFLPECGAGADALDPSKDPEIRESAKVFDIPKLLPVFRQRGGR